MKRIIISLSVLFLFACSEKETTYYESGSVHFEIEMKDGVRHGKSIEYYDDGKVRFVQSWRDGRLDGRTIGYHPNGNKVEETYYELGKKVGNRYIFYDNGTLMEKQVYDKKGRLTDFHSYNIDGVRDSTREMPIFFLDKDTLSRGEQNTFYVRLANVDSLQYAQGKLYLSSGVSSGNELIDTVAVIEANDNRFNYSFIEKGMSGRHVIAGSLIFIVRKNGVIEQQEFMVTYPYTIK